MTDLLLRCLLTHQPLNQTLLSCCVAWCFDAKALCRRLFMDVSFCLLMCMCVFLLWVEKENSNEGGRDRQRDGETYEKEWESWDEMLTWSFLMVQKRPVSSEALLRLQRNAFLIFAPEELTDHRPVCSLSKDSCLCSFLIRTKALCD